MDARLAELKSRLMVVNDLRSAAALLSWDQTTYMPPGGAVARGRQMATLERLAHEKFTEPAICKLLDDLRPYEASLPYDSDEASLIRVTRRDYEKSAKVPPSFMGQLLPAVTEPSLTKIGFNLAICSRLASARGDSSVSMVTSFRPTLVTTGTICSLKTPASMALVAFM